MIRVMKQRKSTNILRQRKEKRVVARRAHGHTSVRHERLNLIPSARICKRRDKREIAIACFFILYMSTLLLFFKAFLTIV
mmetsp:Transcript_29067/g.40203  ORF Transcript_29067/g.40203 Transcript_29067/m.40203 type:complete len:80 (+) Transcript_29067:1464-1703(+)